MHSWKTSRNTGFPLTSSFFFSFSFSCFLFSLFFLLIVLLHFLNFNSSSSESPGRRRKVHYKNSMRKFTRFLKMLKKLVAGSPYFSSVSMFLPPTLRPSLSPSRDAYKIFSKFSSSLLGLERIRLLRRKNCWGKAGQSKLKIQNRFDKSGGMDLDKELLKTYFCEADVST